ncbi:MAG: endopeptidase La [Gammaproteobacteria bacterium]|nr:endopeptidase La [Gammaproteobacteria bacterium]
MTDDNTQTPELLTAEQELPLLPLRDVVVFPHMVIPLFVGRAPSIAALNHAMENGKKIFLSAQKDAATDELDADGIQQTGTIATILQLLKLPDGTVKVLIEGAQRAEIQSFTQSQPFFSVKVKPLHSREIDEREEKVLCRSALEQFEQYIKESRKIPPEILTALSGIEEAERLADTISAHLALKLDEKQHILEIVDINKRLEHLLAVMEAEIELLEVEQRMRGRVKKQMEKSQREYYLNEQMKAIQKELGDMEGDESEELQKKIAEAGLSKEAEEKALGELKKLKMMSPMSAEAGVIRNYIDWLINIPWKSRSRIRNDLERAEAILNEDHYGLEKVKERILEYLAVQQRVRKLKGPILCLVGPPGVGKTSLGRSIAKATNRKFVRMSLGGVRDEAEIRGHRRTYVGSLPGKVMQSLSKVKSRNPLFVLDEIDKLGQDFRGDPASALLEVLDPEQNNSFNDHYLEVDYDLSDVMFVATANTLNIPPALLDRMEVIRLAGYTEDEKLNIAKRYLIAKQLTANGLKAGELKVSDGAVLDIIRYYTREAGVRNLDREIANLCRKAVRELGTGKSKKQQKLSITSRNLGKYLGVRRHSFGEAEEQDRIGHVNGLAWTEVGGELLTVECSVVDGKGNLLSTGRLGDVMQESIKAALTVVRSRAEGLGLDPEFHQKSDIHVHVPEGATPKDGPSAGAAMCTALVSALTGIPVRAEVAMTGEITLRGEVLPIGGLKEKLLAAARGGIKTVLIPMDNKKDLADIPETISKQLQIIPVRWIDEVFSRALAETPEPGIRRPSGATTTPKQQAEKKTSEVQTH